MTTLKELSKKTKALEQQTNPFKVWVFQGYGEANELKAQGRAGFFLIITPELEEL